MKEFKESRRGFLKGAGMLAGGALLAPKEAALATGAALRQGESRQPAREGPADYTIEIETRPVEIAPQRIVSVTTYNGQFPGPLLRFREGRQVTVDIINRTRRPEQLHWHGQLVPDSVDGTAEEGTPFIPAEREGQEGRRRIVFTPRPAGFRFYHSHIRAGANLSAGTYGGEVGPVYIEPRNDPGRYDREVFLVMKEFQPTFSHGGDMNLDFLSPATQVQSLKEQGEAEMKASLAKGMPRGYEVGYGSFTINGRMLGHGEPIRVKPGERVLFRILNGSATEIRSLALPGHSFEVVALDGNPVPNPAKVPVVWLGVAERIDAIVEMNHPGVWVMGDLDNDDRHHGMGIVVEYAGRTGEAQWVTPAPSRWDYMRFAKPGATAPEPDETFDMLFQKNNAALDGFNQWTINGVAFPATGVMVPAAFHLREGKRYRIRMRNATDDIHPIHLHRHVFELTRVAGVRTAGVAKDVVMLGGYQEMEIDFVANDPGLTIFHCHQQIHMDFGFMTLFDYV
ncbi:MAG TPA: multicopper oxidase domain-containing protein [Patescibacteria group bacterium]|nr:multicopper oxidase domain-containing protein [Patescibacteria group bacterium]